MEQELIKLKKGVFVLGGIVVLLAVLSGFLYFIAMNSKNNYDKKDPSSEKIVSVNVKKELLEDLNVFFGDNAKEYWKDWNYKDKVVFAHIIFFDFNEEDVVVKISPPPYEKFSNQQRTIKLNCPNDKTIAVKAFDPQENVVNYNFDIFDQAKMGDTIIGYCLDEECNSIGRKCYLMVRSH